VVLGKWQRVEAALMGVTQAQVIASYLSLKPLELRSWPAFIVNNCYVISCPLASSSYLPPFLGIASYHRF